MKIEDPALMNYLWSWEVMRRIGFRAEEIFLAVTPPGGLVQPTPRAEARRYDQPVIACEVRRGSKKFLWVIGPTTIPMDKLQDTYDAAIDAWNKNELEDTSQEDFRKSAPFQQSTQVLIALNAKGIL